MKATPKVSVIVPNYNHAAFLSQRIESILDQSFQDFELILLDDCSADNSREILNRYCDNPHVTHIEYNAKNSGSPFHQWAKGIALARGEWIWIAESDDWAEPHLLETLLGAVTKHPSCGLVYGLARRIKNGKEPWKTPVTGIAVAYSGSDFARQLTQGNVIYNVSMTLIRNNLLKQIDIDALGVMRLCGDWMLYAKLCTKTDVLAVNRIVSNYRMHDNNTSLHAYNEGRALTEGITVIEYLVRHFRIPPHHYIRNFGRDWMKQERDYHFTPAIRWATHKQIAPRHPLIFAFYLIYRIRNHFRRYETCLLAGRSKV